MSLRVLLADESDTIKKVFQLALQEMQAEVKSVHSGLDVIDVALTFKPDIIFADVLLQKRNGYEICLELKQHPKLNQLPVILMWSSFMELDQNQFKKSLANDQLEKPFDADFLRDLVKKFVGGAAPEAAAPAVVEEENPMAAFLSFPPKAVKENSKITLNPLPEVTHQEDASEFNIAAQPDFSAPATATPYVSPGKSLFDDLKVEAQKQDAAQAASAPAGLESWQTTDLSKFKVEENKNDSLDKFEALNLGGTKKETSQVVAMPNLDTIFGKEGEAIGGLNVTGSGLTPKPKVNTQTGAFDIDKIRVPSSQQSPSSSSITKAPTTAQTGAVSTRGLNDGEIEAIVRAHTEEFIKTEIKNSLIDLMEKIVREELNRVLEEEVNLKQELGREQS